MKEIDLNKITYRTSKKEDALEHWKACQETYQEASEFLPFFVGIENWSVPDHEKYLVKFAADSQRVKNLLFFYENQIIGGGHLKPSDWNYSGELLYWVRSGWDGLGIGAFIAKTMLASAYTNFGYRHLIIQTDRNNIGSQNVAKKLGAWVGLVYGYVDHRGIQSNMVVWVKETPFVKIASRFRSDYGWDPISPKSGGIYRVDHENKLANYMAPDPERIRAK